MLVDVQTRAGFESSWTERDFGDLYVLTFRGRQCIHEWKATSQWLEYLERISSVNELAL